MTKWDKSQIENHIQVNTTDEAGGYSSVVVIAGFFKKLYGELPKVRLSGTQAECADLVCSKLPDKL